MTDVQYLNQSQRTLSFRSIKNERTHQQILSFTVHCEQKYFQVLNFSISIYPKVVFTFRLDVFRFHFLPTKKSVCLSVSSYVELSWWSAKHQSNRWTSNFRPWVAVCLNKCSWRVFWLWICSRLGWINVEGYQRNSARIYYLSFHRVSRSWPFGLIWSGIKRIPEREWI